MAFEEVVILVPCHSLEDFPTELAEGPAESLLNAFSIAWHPRLLAHTRAMPRWRRADEFTLGEGKRLVLIPRPSDDWLAHDRISELRTAGSFVVQGATTRQEYLDAALAPLEDETADIDADLVNDFYALGLSWLMTELLTRQMRNISVVDHVRLESEAVAASVAAAAGDRAAAESRLQKAFEALLECRERFYPVDCYLIDLCLMSVKQATEAFTSLCRQKTPFSLLLTGEDLAELAASQPETAAAIRESVASGTCGLVGGDWRETAASLMPLDHAIWNLKRGQAEFERTAGATPKVWGRRRYGLGPFIPQLATRTGGESALHFVVDDGVYPDEEHMKFRWQGCDGVALDAISRIPLAGDSASSFLRLPTRLAESMDHDHAAGLVFARWPEMRTPFLNDLRRAFRYSPILGKFVTLEKFFTGTDIPGRLSDFKAGEYLSPLLVQAVARQEEDPISRYARESSRRTRFRAAKFCSDLANLLTHGRPDAKPSGELRDRIEEADPDEADDAHEKAEAALLELRPEAEERFRDVVAPGGPGTAGWLAVNPLSFSRKAVVSLPNEHRVVELPPSGFAFVPAAKPPENLGKKSPPSAEGLVLRNEFFEVLLSEASGGIAQIRTFTRSPNRISQQLALRFPRERTIEVGEGENASITKTYYSEMLLDSSRVLTNEPGLGEIETVGRIVDQIKNVDVAEFRQVTRVRRGRPSVEIDIRLTPKIMPEGDPWTNYFGARWAWKHETAAVSRSLHETAHPVGEEPRIEAPHFVEIADDNFRTTILPHGLPFHRRTGPRMLDTLLIVAGETRRDFRFDIAIDELYPQQVAFDVMSPPVLIPVAKAPPTASAWLFHLGARNVVLFDLLPLDAVDGAIPVGCIARLLETEGRHRTFGLRCFRQPVSARQRDFTGKTIQECSVTPEEVLVEVSPYEICDVELKF